MPRKTKTVKGPAARRESNVRAAGAPRGLPGPTVYALAEKLRGFVREAERAGFAVIVDSDRIAIRLVAQTLVDSGADLRVETLGSAGVAVHGACGGGSSRGDVTTHGAP